MKLKEILSVVRYEANLVIENEERILFIGHTEEDAVDFKEVAMWHEDDAVLWLESYVEGTGKDLIKYIRIMVE